MQRNSKKGEWEEKKKQKRNNRNKPIEKHDLSRTEGKKLPEDVLIGRNAVIEALRSERGINKILLAEGDRAGSVKEILSLARERGIVVQSVNRSKLEALAGGMRHQGVLAYVSPVAYAELEDILKRAAEKEEPPFLLLLDELEDPHNLGALLRTADAAGVHGVLIPKRRSVPLNATVAKTSAGAVEYVPVARIGNISQTLRELKQKGMWVAGADMGGEQTYYEADLTGPLVLVIGSEGHGMSRLTREQCDFVVRMPMAGRINSLNASVAGSILMYEVMRQRLLKRNGSRS
ncbi:23S rRNA (guanosine(2251)-2'-O)-methyltransferase RlmB [Selenomonas montiformis]|uniref:23S rRNA (Guanosine(2251)-2'-O)-methyltransferase RlmB n=1 Tax=Selenomonas montiformis TaxID=2652285 RepID=A0A6I2UXI7_9FIRM|nr:23S rRNA (guanosine(2251)-2'-O)-methyltransferase RlmB [Selenomonas montiformis]MDY4697344.1 23S rRNA (guanosine(2251)-2'-O)-methyltransferase RlmB [Selenomonas montiformis]MSV25109.1 23S rRNA (guanosine(2251)-2'-O)-methyltransferase RlmB [Selenomonas montiformis]